ncbi:TPR-like protein [Dentipellis sp. KUC8613]|nr:TPR-like protein [Dentipellis sp. KUC8613]
MQSTPSVSHEGRESDDGGSDYHSVGEASDVEEVQSEESLRNCLRDAEELKKEGNEYFRAKEWNQALLTYRRALARLPQKPKSKSAQDKGKGKAKERLEEFRDAKPPGSTEDQPSDTNIEPVGPVEPPSAIEVEVSKARAVLNANIGACHVQLGEHEEAVKACSQALLDDPEYTKALQRRAQSNEKIGSWSSLSKAQEDYKKLLEILPSSSPQAKEVQRTLRLLEPRVEAAQKKEMDEMLGKLKGFGNTILGKFGLSTDNFKFEPNGQGGYSMNFTQ